jgi:hypothetical protein
MAPEHRGQGGFTRAQTAQVLVNSLVIEIVVLCIFHSAPSEGPMVINPTAVVIGTSAGWQGRRRASFSAGSEPERK